MLTKCEHTTNILITIIYCWMLINTKISILVTLEEGAAAVAINENLFIEEDLEGLEEELGDLDLEE